MFKTANPFVKKVDKQTKNETTYADYQVASYKGVALKTGLLIVLAVLSGFLASFLLNFIKDEKNIQLFSFILVPLAIVAFIAVLVGYSSTKGALVASIIYALAEGFILGTLATVINIYLPFAGWIAAGGVMLIFIAMFLLYFTRMIVINNKFLRSFIGIFFVVIILSVISLLLAIFNPNWIGTIWFGMLISVVFIIYGAIMLALDFNNVERSVKAGADKKSEWQLSLGIMLSIVWIYVQLLRLMLYIAASRK